MFSFLTGWNVYDADRHWAKKRKAAAKAAKEARPMSAKKRRYLEDKKK